MDERDSADATSPAAPRWPVWYAPLGFIAAIAAVLVVVGLIAAVAALAGADVDGDPAGLTLAATFVQDGVLIAAALAFTAVRVRPRMWHLGLRRTPLWPAIAVTALAMAGFYAFTAAYVSLAAPDGEQTIVEDLGADQGGVLLVASALLIVGLAPVAEEVFFRAFFYGALRTRLGVAPAAALAGLLFGAIHYTGSETLELLPPLIALGVAFCLLYERTGSLYPAIAFHALNNAIALSAEVGAGGAPVALTVGAVTVALCFAVPARQRRGAPLPFGSRQWAGTPA